MADDKKTVYRLRAGRGKHRIYGRVVKAGDKLEAFPWELGNALDKFEVIERGTTEDDVSRAIPTQFVIVEDGDGYNVTNEGGFVGNMLSDVPLSLEDAKSLLEAGDGTTSEAAHETK